VTEKDKEIQRLQLKKLHARIEERLLRLRLKTCPDESVRSFAEKAGLSHSHVGRMEGRLEQTSLKSGADSSPTVSRLFKHLSKCGKSLAEFFTEVEGVKYPGSPHKASHVALHERMQDLLDQGKEVEGWVSERLSDIEARAQAEYSGKSQRVS
jgi:hypothetical protein